jgi:hypothetical protein
MKALLNKIPSKAQVFEKCKSVKNKAEAALKKAWLSFTEKPVVRERNRYEVKEKISKQCFFIAMDRFNNGGYFVNLQNHKNR